MTSHLNEDEIIGILKQNVGVVPKDILGIGDDAAVIHGVGGNNYVISQDHLVEGVHFRLTYFNPESLAHKVLHVNLSDIAAMGAKPQFVLLGLALPATLDMKWVQRFSESFLKLSLEHEVILIGGDTTASSDQLYLGVTIIGSAPIHHIKYRHKAKPGNIICVAGILGESFAGLRALEENKSGFEHLKTKSLRPQALLQEGAWLGKRPEVTAMMDISDGLYVDLQRLIKSSSVGARLVLDHLYPSKELQFGCVHLGLDVMQCLLAGGEDYALLFTVDASLYDRLAHQFQIEFNYSLQNIGNITSEADIKLFQNEHEVSYHFRAYSHFDTH